MKRRLNYQESNLLAVPSAMSAKDTRRTPRPHIALSTGTPGQKHRNRDGSQPDRCWGRRRSRSNYGTSHRDAAWVNWISSLSFLSHPLTPCLVSVKVEESDPSSSSARFTLKFLEDVCSLSKPCRSRPDGCEDQRPKGKAPRVQTAARWKKRERGRRPSGSMDRRIAGGVPGLSQIGTLSALRVTMHVAK